EFEHDDSALVRAVRHRDGRTLSVERDDDGLLKALASEDGNRLQVSRDEDGYVIAEQVGTVSVDYPLTAGRRVASVTVDGDEHARFTWSGDALIGIGAFGREIGLASVHGQRATEIRFPNGISQRADLSADARVMRERLIDARGRTLDDRAYDYDDAGRVSEMWGPEYRQVRYDARGHVIAVERTDGSVERYGYDEAGHLLASPWGGEHFVDTAGRVVRTRRETLEYDTAGRVVSRRTSEGTTRYSYDTRDRLTTVILPAGQW